jgi:hypothetical protein
MITFDAHFDGENLRPEAPIVLPQNVRLRVTVIESNAAEEDSLPANGVEPSKDLFGDIEAKYGLIDGPADWSLELDHYLYGTPKRGDAPQA